MAKLFTRRHSRTVVLTVVLVAAITMLGPAAGSAPTIVIAQTCAASGTQTPTGSILISKPMLPQITSSSLPITVPATINATTQINPGGTVTTTAALQLDLAAVAADVLTARVKPAVIAAGYPNLAPTAWDVLTLDDAVISFAIPAAAAPSGVPTASSADSPVTAAFAGQTIRLRIAHLQADTRSPQPLAEFTVSWDAIDGGAPAPRTLVLEASTITFTVSVDVGLLFYGSPVIGGVTGPWTCTPDQPGKALATTEVVSAPVATTPSSTTTTEPVSTTSTAPPSTTTTTTWPSTTITPVGSCAVSGFDVYGGYAAIDLGSTGFFRTTQYEGRWWLVDPDGHPFFSQGINHVTFNGTPDQFGDTAYLDAVTLKYGTPQNWANAQVQRMRDWGYNTLGAWSDVDTFAGQEPYTLLLDMTDQNFGTGVMEDLWAPAWENRVNAAVASKVAPYRDDPLLLGYWTDNELHWGPDWRLVHLFDEYTVRDAATSPGKQELMSFLQQQYPTFVDFAADFTTSATDWATFAAPSSVTAWTAAGGEATRAAWVGAVAERYFSYTSAAIEAADPNHLNLGPRMMAQVTGTPVLEVAARYIDVASFNDYAIIPELAAPLRNADPTYLSVDNALAAQSQLMNLPIIVSEWSFRAADSGLPNSFPPLFPTLQTQAQRAAAYEAFAMSLHNNPSVVGQHWFEHADEPPAGRPGGEDSNFGLVNLADDPYPEMTDISRTMHDCAYARLLAPAPAPETTTTGPVQETTTTVIAVGPNAIARPVRAQPAFTG